MKRISIILAIILLIPFVVLADGKNKPKKKAGQATGKTVKKNAKAVPKKKATPKKRSKPLKVDRIFYPPLRTKESDEVLVYAYCTHDSPVLSVQLYFQTVIFEAVRITAEQPENTLHPLGHKHHLPENLEDLRDGKILSELYEKLRPVMIETYPGLSLPNSAVINSLVMHKALWTQVDLLALHQILEQHTAKMGFKMIYNTTDCGLENFAQSSNVN